MGEGMLDARAVVVEVVSGEDAFWGGVVGDAAESDGIVCAVEEVDVLAGVI